MMRKKGGWRDRLAATTETAGPTESGTLTAHLQVVKKLPNITDEETEDI